MSILSLSPDPARKCLLCGHHECPFCQDYCDTADEDGELCSCLDKNGACHFEWPITKENQEWIEANRVRDDGYFTVVQDRHAVVRYEEQVE